MPFAFMQSGSKYEMVLFFLFQNWMLTFSPVEHICMDGTT